MRSVGCVLAGVALLGSLLMLVAFIAYLISDPLAAALAVVILGPILWYSYRASFPRRPR